MTIETLMNEMLHNDLTDIQEIDVTEMWRERLMRINFETCTWSGYSEPDPGILTECGSGFDYFDYTDYKYCPYCGKKIK